VSETIPIPNDPSFDMTPIVQCYLDRTRLQAALDEANARCAMLERVMDGISKQLEHAQGVAELWDCVAVPYRAALATPSDGSGT
jgi:hypothetical protein